MRLQIIAIGKMKSGALKELFDDYSRRLTCSFSLRELESKTKGSAEEIKLDEQNFILDALPRDAYVVLLDERGEDLSNDALTLVIKHAPRENLVFVVGGAYGVTSLIRSKAHKIISFGRVTWPHMLVRVMLMEQLYRSQQILKNHPYHKR